jgi:M6 family metalloprotease-like protein
VLSAGTAAAAYLRNVPQTVRQPDGAVLHLLATGDEFSAWLHDSLGYLVVRRPDDGVLTYAVEDGGKTVPSRFVVGRDDPEQAGLTPGLRPAPGLAVTAAAARQGLRASAAAPGKPTFTAINNLVVFVRFADEPEFTRDRPLSVYDAKFNDTAPGAVSVRNYFQQASYGQVTVQTTFYPRSPDASVVSFQDAHPRSYYLPFNAASNPTGYTDEDANDRVWSLVAAAAAAIGGEVPAGLDLDTNSDGKVDNLCLLISGDPVALDAVSGGALVLWPQKGELQGRKLSIHGKAVSVYNIQLEGEADVSAFCHEMTHTQGAPDLYNYHGSGAPVGEWDLMAWTREPPQQIGAYVKWRYLGWISTIPVIASPGAYALRSVASATQNCYRIESPNAAQEYFVLEYRRQGDPFDATIPGSGLLAYRINDRVQGNMNGPPDNVYIYRLGGSVSDVGFYWLAAMGSHVGRTAIDGTTDPYAFLADGSLAGLSVSDIGAAGDTIPFKVGIQPACSLGGFAQISPESPVHSGELAFQWSASAGATSYELHLGSYPNPVPVTTTTGLSSAASMAPGDFRVWNVVASSSCGALASGPTWPLDADPKVPLLRRGESLSDLESPENLDWRFFQIDVPAGARALTFAISGGTGDADLAVRRGHFPNVARYDCLSEEIGNADRCTIAFPEPGVWYAAVITYEPFAGLSLTSDFAVAPRHRLRR